MSSSISDLSQDGASKRKALLTRSNAMCGDDDTRLRVASDQNELGGENNSRTKRYSTTSSVSKDSSHPDYTDSTGIDLMQFIMNTLHKNAKDREMLLSLESEMRKFVVDKNRQAYKFPKMSSYNRMLVHRVAAFFGLDHNIDQSGTLVVVNKTPNTRVPELEFSKCIKNNVFTDRILGRRSVQSFDECQLNNMYANFPAVQSKLAFGSAANAAWPTISSGEPALSASLEMVRRAHSFEVGEWNNGMAAAAAVAAGAVGGGGSGGGGGGNGSGGGPTSSLMLSAGSTTLPHSAYLCNTADAVMGRTSSSSNSNSSWQLAGNTPSNANIQFVSSRPESIISPVGSVIIDSNSAFYAHPPPPLMTNNAQQQFSGPAVISAASSLVNRQYSQDAASAAEIKNESESTTDGVAPPLLPPPHGTAVVVPQQQQAPAGSGGAGGVFLYGAAAASAPLPAIFHPSQCSPIQQQQQLSPLQQQQISPQAVPSFYPLVDVRQPNVPIFYFQSGGAPRSMCGGGDYAPAGGGAAGAQYYIAQYAPPFPLPVGQPSNEEALNLSHQFRQAVQISPDANLSANMIDRDASAQFISYGNSTAAAAPQVIPYNTPTGVCYVTVGGRPAVFAQNSNLPTTTTTTTNALIQQQQQSGMNIVMSGSLQEQQEMLNRNQQPHHTTVRQLPLSTNSSEHKEP